MAVTRRGYIFSAFLLSVLCVLLIVIAVASDSWVVSTVTADTQVREGSARYGLFRGELEVYLLITATVNPLYMTCLPDINACAVSCKLEQEAREAEVRALANRLRPNPGCLSVTDIEVGNLLDEPAVISFAFYVCLLVLLFLQLVSAIVSAVLAIINATRNPTEPAFGLPGCLWSNVVTGLFGVTVLMMFGIYWAVSGLQSHLALAPFAVDEFDGQPALGFSYWLLIVAVLCSFGNVGLIELRKYMLERDPPPPTIKVENHSDGTIFLY